VHSINMRLSREGTKLTIRAIEALTAGRAPPVQTQRREVGFLTLSRQWSPHLSAQVRHIERNGLLERMLKYPSRPALPIVELGPSST
jgi:hypothetical protein